MPDSSAKTNAQLLDEIRSLRELVTKLESRESEWQTHAWLELSPVCTKIVGLDFNLLYMSRAGIVGLNIDDIAPYYGNPYPFDFFPQAFRHRMTANLNKVVKTGEIVTLEAPVVDIDGNEIWFHSTLLPIKDDHGRIDYIMIVSINVTERIRAENDRLSLERQVQHAQKLESLGVLSGGIAHDFNNILMSILGNADLALEGLSPHAPINTQIKEIKRAARRAADLAREMLAYSGKGRFVIEPIDMNEFVDEMGHLLDVSISKKATLNYNFVDDLPLFDGDATQIRQVIMNLITNASEAIGDKNGIITLSTGAVECDRTYLDNTNIALRAGLDEPLPEGLYICLEVADTGCGMDAETIEKIFDPFFSSKFAGRGLGMSAVLGIIRGHNGAINICSELSKGTTFKILFPAVELGKGDAATRSEDRSKANAWRGKGTVLVADDEEMVRVVSRRMLESLGFKVLTAIDGHDAVKVFRKHTEQIVCILLDLTMPNLDGEQAFHEIRRIRSDVRVVLSSGYNMQDATHCFVGKGLAGFIQKPYDQSTLRETMKEVLGVDGYEAEES